MTTQNNESSRQTQAQREHAAVIDFLKTTEAYLDALQHSVLNHNFLLHRRTTPSAAHIGDPSSWALMDNTQTQLELCLKREVDALQKVKAGLEKELGL